jgi:hypothetical protein
VSVRTFYGRPNQEKKKKILFRSQLDARNVARMQTAVNSHRLTAGLFRRQRRPAASRQLKQNDAPVLQEAGGGIRLEKRRCWSWAPAARLPQLTRLDYPCSKPGRIADIV